MRRLLLLLSLATLGLGALVAVGTVAVETMYGVRVQRVTPYPEPLRALTGELGAREGEPVEAIILPSTPVLDRKDGIVFVDRTLVYPLQVRSLRLVGHGAAGSLALGALLILFARRFVRPLTPDTVTR